MKTQTLVPALALAAALLASPSARADSRHRSEGGRGSSAHGDYGHPQDRGSYRYGYRSSPGYRNGYGHGNGYGYHGYRQVRPYYRSHRSYAPPPPYYGYGYGYGGYGYGGYDAYGYGYYPPPPRYCPPRPRVGFWFGF
jgi:hypothetical protein